MMSGKTSRYVVGVYLLLWYVLALAYFAKPYGARWREAQDKSYEPPDKYLVMLGVTFLGALGSVVTCTRAYVSNPESKTLTWYFFSPLMGMLMANFCYVAMRAGFLAATTSPPTNAIENANIYFFVAIVAGLFSEAAYHKFAEIAGTVFQTREDYAKAGSELAPTRGGQMLIQLAQARDLLQAVFRLRYQVLVEQENLEIPSSDHDAKTIEDDYDESAYVLAASSGSSAVVGTARTVLWRSLPNFLVDENGVPEILTRIGFTPSSLNSDACSYSSRMVIAKGPRHMKYRIARRLAEALFHYGKRSGVQVDFILCVRDYLAFFRRLGYREFASGVESPDTQRQCHLMYLLGEDAAHLQKMRSPLAEFCGEPESQRHEKLRRTIEDYREEFHRQSRLIPS